MGISRLIVTVQSFAFLSMRDCTRKALGLVMDDLAYGDGFFEDHDYFGGALGWLVGVYMIDETQAEWLSA